jgi:hypothetical protein
MLSPELQLIAIIVGPAGLTGLVIAWMGHRNQRAKPATLSPEAMTMIGQGTGSQMAMDMLSVRIERLCLSNDRLTDTLKDLIDEIKNRRS